MESLEEYASTSRDESGDVFQSAADGPDQMMMAAERRTMVAEALAKLETGIARGC